MVEEIEPVDRAFEVPPNEHLKLLDDVGRVEWREAQCQAENDHDHKRDLVEPGHGRSGLNTITKNCPQ